MRTSFEFKIVSNNLEEAKTIATAKVAKFLGIAESEVSDQVSLELKVAYPEAKTLVDIEAISKTEEFVVTVYGSVKQSVVRPL